MPSGPTPMATIDYSALTAVATEGTHVVYTKANWLDSWVAQPNLKCIECQWNAAPQFATAVLHWDLGNVVLPGDTTPTTFTANTNRGQFVRIDWTCDDATTLRWVGFIESNQWPTDAFGDQAIICYGLEHALAKTPILDAVVRGEDGMGDPIGERTGIPLRFGSGEGLRSADEAVDSEGIYAFAAYGDTGAVTWSTKAVVEYLMHWHLPTSSYGVANIPWAIDQASLLPDWDQVSMETRGRTVWDLLNELLSPERQLGFTVGSDGSTAYLRIFTHARTTLTVNSNTVIANPTQHTLTFAPDALTDAQFADIGNTYDQVVVRGDRRKSICTLSIDPADGIFANDWSSSQETEYEDGASGEAGYGALTDEEKRLRNAAVRRRQKLAEVFRRFKLDEDWDFTDGTNDVFPDSPDPHEPLRLQILPRLPIKPGVDWSGTVSTDDFDRDGEGREMLLTWVDPVNSVVIDNAGLDQLQESLEDDLGYDFAVMPQVAYNRKIDLLVLGGPQHAIADATFSGQTVDAPDNSPVLDYETAKITLCIAEDRHVQGIWPTTAPSADVVRRLVVNLGEAYQQIYIVADTVTEVSDADGTEETSDGGYLVDDSDALQSIAEFVGRSLLPTRKTVRWSSLRKLSDVEVGDLITTAAGTTIDAPVTSVHIRAPLSLGKPAPPSRQSFAVYSGRVDPLGLLYQMGGIQSQMRQRRYS